MKCKKCGYDNPDDSNFCSRCGSCLKTVCPKCGKEVSPEDSYCGGCGFQLIQTDIETTKAQDNSKTLPQDDGKVHFRTEINGKKFAFAAFVSYIGLPISIVLNFIQFILLIAAEFDETPFGCFLLFFLMTCQIIAVAGLSRFSYNAFRALMFGYGIGILGNLLLLIGLAVSEVYLPILIYYECEIVLEACFCAYFGHRSFAYTRK